jgi:hypothetical protein
MPKWQKLESLPARNYICSYCGNLVSSSKGYCAWISSVNNSVHNVIYICPHCEQPTYFFDDKRIPGQLFGDKVKHLPREVEDIYDEARKCITVNAYTGSVMLCRKLLMNIAVQKGAPKNQTFASYVDYLCNSGYVSGDNKVWADLVRNKGNEANHEIPKMSPSDAEELIEFLELVLKSVYEFPEKAKQRISRPPNKTAP